MYALLEFVSLDKKYIVANVLSLHFIFPPTKRLFHLLYTMEMLLIALAMEPSLTSILPFDAL